MGDKMSATQLLHRTARGDRGEVDALIPLIYDQLHEIAARMASRERRGHTLAATALVNEAYVRLIDQNNVDPNDRAHFFAVAANVIRRILVDHARQRHADKRGGDWKRITLSDVDRPDDDKGVDLLDLHDALSRLNEISPRAAAVVELRYFGGLTVDEAAESLKVSPRTVADEWAFARAWLARELSRGSDEVKPA